ncbi:zinc finger CCCH domain-containing protein 66 [Dorcoceras hygrometricum]|uniref:Zinc finger CCCH domain-containing protein 66 n=1 Tax=Dorcoceras hygrometricum TaxID=472368 RepID=A0A2Z7B739_9LAMI|nr:zinc finger CCCH domain-containing protein 66 [Dorcoceras hygrometricum]
MGKSEIVISAFSKKNWQNGVISCWKLAVEAEEKEFQKSSLQRVRGTLGDKEFIVKKEDNDKKGIKLFEPTPDIKEAFYYQDLIQVYRFEDKPSYESIYEEEEILVKKDLMENQSQNPTDEEVFHHERMKTCPISSDRKILRKFRPKKQKMSPGLQGLQKGNGDPS